MVSDGRETVLSLPCGPHQMFGHIIGKPSTQEEVLRCTVQSKIQLQCGSLNIETTCWVTDDWQAD